MKRIAIVNNEAALAEVVRYNLERAGFSVCVYLRGIDALAGLIEEPCDLVMLDKFNPPLGGVALLRELRKHTQTPVIFLTPHAEDIAQELRGTDLEADDYIVCPFSMDDLLERVKAIFERRGTQGELHGIQGT